MSDVHTVDRWGVEVPTHYKVDDAMWLLTMGKGSRVEVYRGRKVAPGTRGEVFWVGEGDYGTRLGLKDDDGATHWLAYRNCRPEGWPQLVALATDHGWDYLVAQLEAMQVKKGDRVRHISAEGEVFEGEVFWAEGRRLGLRVGEGQGHNGGDALWLNSSQVEKLADISPEMLSEVHVNEDYINAPS